MKRRRTHLRGAVLGAALGLLAPRAAAAQPGIVPTADTLVTATLVADVLSIEPGRPFHLGVRFRIADGWHINWINPGDAGLAPSIGWRLGDDFAVQEMQWPSPHRYTVGPLVIFGYNGTVTLWTAVTPGSDIEPGTRVTLAAGVDWLACEEGCVPGQADLTLSLPVEATSRPSPAGERSYREFERRVPAPEGRWRVSAYYDEDSIVLEIDPTDPSMRRPEGPLYFFPHDQGIIENAAPQRLEHPTAGYRLVLRRSLLVHATPARLTGVLVSENGWGEGTGPGLQVDAALERR